MAGELAIEGAQPLRYNGYKIPLMRNLVKRAIRGTGGGDDLARIGRSPDCRGAKRVSTAA